MKNISTKKPITRSGLISSLQEIQERTGYLPEAEIEKLSQRTGISANEIYGVATFYSQFRFSPPGEHTIRVCQGTACHVRHGKQILAELEHHLKIKVGETTADGLFDLERVACLGCCALAPVVVVDEKVYARMTTQKISSVLSQYRKGGTKEK